MLGVQKEPSSYKEEQKSFTVDLALEESPLQTEKKNKVTSFKQFKLFGGNSVNSLKSIDGERTMPHGKSGQMSDQLLKKQAGPYSVQLDEKDSEKGSVKEGHDSGPIEQIKLGEGGDASPSTQPAVLHSIVSPLNEDRPQTDQQILEQAQEMTICAPE
jgi:hypothetical protein